MSLPTPADLVARAGELASLPGTWQNVDAVLSKPTASSQQISEAISADPALSVRMLRLANSPLFGLSQRVERLSQAVHLVGTRQVRDLCLASTVLDCFAGVPATRATMPDLAKHSLATGLFARAIAGRRRETNVERFFVAGLLHDVGLLLLLMQLPTDEGIALGKAAAGIPLEIAEQDELGYDHAAVGGLLVERWRLPASLSEPVRCHHAPCASTAYPIESAVIHVASLGVDLLGISAEGPVSTPLDPKAWELIGLQASDLPVMIEEVDRQIEALAGIMLQGKA